MRDAQYLESLIKKALDNDGFQYIGKPENGWGYDVGQWHTSDTHLCINHGKGQIDEYIAYGEFLFRHDFAKSIFGEAEWRDRLAQAVLSNNPVQYFGEHGLNET